jgi:argininosuccinate lyase
VLRPSKERAPIDPASLATDIAEELVRQGVPFRAAHERVGRWARLAAESEMDLREICGREAPELSAFAKRLTPESSAAARDLPGGTAPRRVRAAIARTRGRLEAAPR